MKKYLHSNQAIIGNGKTERVNRIISFSNMIKYVEKSFKDKKSIDEYLAESRTDRKFN